MVKEDLINAILKLKPGMNYEKLRALSNESLVIIQVQLEFEQFYKSKKNNAGNEPKKEPG